MNKFKFNATKSILSGLFLLSLSSAASALALLPAYAASADTSGRVSMQTNTYATVNGTGGSFSHAETQTGSFNNGFATANQLGINISGTVNGYVNAVAYNTSIGSGTGSANAGGGSGSSFNASALQNVGDSGYVTGTVGIDGGMGNMVSNGIDAHVNATTAQDGYASGTYVATAGLVGNVNGLTGFQTAENQVNTGAITFTGGAPVGQTAAGRFVNTGVDTNVQGSYINSVQTITQSSQVN